MAGCANTNEDPLFIGARVSVPIINEDKRGTIRWLGNFKSVLLAGVEMDTEISSANDGTHKFLGKCFDCPTGYGIFISQNRCRRITEDSEQKVKNLSEQLTEMREALILAQKENKDLTKQLKDCRDQLQFRHRREQEETMELMEAREEKQALVEQLEASYEQQQRQDKEINKQLTVMTVARREINTLREQLETSGVRVGVSKQDAADTLKAKKTVQKQLEACQLEFTLLQEKKKEDTQHYYVALTQYNKVKDKYDRLPNNPTVLYIVNPEVRHKFEQKQREFIDKYGEQSKEASPILFFYENADAINIGNVVKENFKDGKLPQGMLFSEYPKVTNRLLLCQVLPGKQNNVREAKWSMSNDPVRRKYDSESSNWENTKVQMIWDEAQVLPFYLIMC